MARPLVSDELWELIEPLDPEGAQAALRLPAAEGGSTTGRH